MALQKFKILCIPFILSLLDGQVYCEKQAQQTCDALNTLVAKRYEERVGQCIINSDCTSLACRAELTIPAPNTAFSIISFDPCSKPVSVYLHVNTSLLKGLPILDGHFTASKSVKAKPEPLGTFYITLQHHDGGVSFGMVHQSQFDPQPVPLFPATSIPFRCKLSEEDSPMDNSNGQAEDSENKNIDMGRATEEDYHYNQPEEDRGNERGRRTEKHIINRNEEGTHISSDPSVTEELTKDDSGKRIISADFNTTANSEDSTASTNKLAIHVSSILQVLMIIVLLGAVVLHVLLVVVNFVACLKF